MKYALFNPVTGLHTFVEANAKEARINLINETAKTSSVPKRTLKPEIANDIAVASEYFSKKLNITEPAGYYHTVFNATTGKYYSYYFVGNGVDFFYELKVMDGKVVEVYDTKNLVANDLETFDVIERYKLVDADLNEVDKSEEFYALAKYSLSGDLLALNIQSYYEDLPQDVKDLLVSFEPKESIFQYKRQAYGVVVHFHADIHLPPTQQQIEEAKEEWIKQWADKFTVCEVYENDRGDATWVSVNTTTW